METITPVSLAPHATTEHQSIRAEKIALFVGQFSGETSFAAFFQKVLQVPEAKTAQQLISRLLNEEHRAPFAIFLDFSSATAKDCESWAAYFKKYQTLRAIPFFLFATKVDEPVKAFAKQYSFVDEVITKNCTEKQLWAKVNFLGKVKRMQALHPNNVAVQKAKYKGDYINNFLKRGLDITAASVGLVLSAPVMAVIAVMIRLESKGPIFYAAKRAGRNYKVFKFYKFRTMVPDADKKLAQLQHLNQYATDGKGPVFYKMSNDPRITKLGNFLRNTSLDEIPQLVNVLRGDMSLVGNRPLPLYEATALTTDEWVERFLAPAGITGLWQISKRGKAEMSVEERIQLDVSYANKNTFAYDMWLMVNTPFALIQKDNV